VFQKKPQRDLQLPPIASNNSQAAEVLRVWAVPGQLQQLTLAAEPIDLVHISSGIDVF